MKIIAIMPDAQGVKEIIDALGKQLSTDDISIRNNYTQAKKAVAEYDVVIAHQNVTSTPLSADDFEQLQDNCRNGVVIPLINGEKGSELVQRLFQGGLYNAIYQEDSSTEYIVGLINNQRNRIDAKEYYGITSSDVKVVSEHILSDGQVKRAIDYIRATNDVEDGFKSSIENLSTPQKLYLIQQFPEDLKESLKESEIYVTYERMLTSNAGAAKQVIIEQTITKETVVEKTQVIQNLNRNRRLFTVMGNSELCAELAYMTAKQTSEDVLIIDIESFVPEIDRIYGMKETVNDGISIGNLVTSSSFLQAYEVAASKNLNYDLFRSIAVQHRFKKLFVLTGNDNLAKHESFNHEPLNRIIDIALDIFGAVYVNIPADIYNALALFMIINPKSTLVVPFDGSAISLANKLQTIKLIKSAQQLSDKNVKYLAFEYHPNVSLDEGDIRKLTDGKYIGKVSYDIGRIKARNDFKSGYTDSMVKKNEEEYKLILDKLGFDTKKKLSTRIKNLLGRNK